MPIILIEGECIAEPGDISIEEKVRKNEKNVTLSTIALFVDTPSSELLSFDNTRTENTITITRRPGEQGKIFGPGHTLLQSYCHPGGVYIEVYPHNGEPDRGSETP